ncbi:MAG: Co/Zn/Cd efflux system component [Phenylobacterium sp.]|jgi:Co/Zn/Cd efflux system component
MAVISCPQCNKKISDKANQCPHCDISTDMDADELQKVARQHVLTKSRKLSNQSMVAMLLFLGGFYVMYFRSPAIDSPQMMVAQGLIVVGFLWYIINRVRLLLLKKGRK